MAKTGQKFNPLALAFGLSLQQLRGNIQSSEVAKALGVSNSYIRLMETGATNISTSRTLKLIEALPQIEFQPICKMLIAINATDDARESAAQYRNVLSDLLSAGKDEDLYFEAMLQKLLSILRDQTEVRIDDKSSFFDKEKTETRIIEEKYSLDIIKFLTSKTISPADFSLKQISEEFANDIFDIQFEKLFGDTPSIYIDSMALLQKHLKTINANLFALDSSEWERGNQQNFVKLIGVFYDFQSILLDENIQNFDYKYLQNETFKELNYIILNEDNKDIYRQKFIEMLNDRWGKKNIEPVFEKIFFKTCSKNNTVLKELLLSKDLSTSYSAVWIFVTNQGNKIGFGLKGDALNKNNEIVYGETLSYARSKEKYFHFSNLWNSLK